MKKGLNKLIVLLSLFVLLISTAAAPFAPRSLTLLGAEYLPSKGFVFDFAVSGTFEPGELKSAKLVIGSQSFGMGCEVLDDSTLRCVASGLAAFEGRNARIELAGLLFYTVIPAKVEPAEPVWAECPDDMSETVYILAYDGGGNTYNGSSNTNPASIFTLDQHLQNWVAFVESIHSVTLVSFEITNVTCIVPIP